MGGFRGKALLAALSAWSLLGWAGAAQAGMIFESNFDSDPSDWNCSAARTAQSWLQGWDGPYSSGCEGPDTFDGQTHYSYEVSPGGRTGNSLKIWTHDSFPHDRTYSNPHIFLPAGHRELYTRWSMKIPPDMHTAGYCDYVKLWRFRFSPAGPNAGTEIYFNANYGTFPDSSWILRASVVATNDNEIFPGGVLADGQWHSYEFRLKLNSSGQSDGIMEAWIDGVQVVSRTDRNFDAVDASTFESTAVGLGNRSGTPFQSAWRAIEFDDYVVSTSYIGPAGTPTPVNADAGILPDAGLPGSVTDLTVAGTTASSVTLSFTEVDDGAGQPASYDVRFSQPPMAWGSATVVSQGTCKVPVVGQSTAAVRTCTVEGLAAATSYDFQLVPFWGTLQVDAVFGPLSNVAQGVTTSGAGVDEGLADASADSGGPCTAGTELDPATGTCVASVPLADAGPSPTLESGCGCGAAGAGGAGPLIFLAGLLALGVRRRRLHR